MRPQTHEKTRRTGQGLKYTRFQCTPTKIEAVGVLQGLLKGSKIRVQRPGPFPGDGIISGFRPALGLGLVLIWGYRRLSDGEVEPVALNQA